MTQSIKIAFLGGSGVYDAGDVKIVEKKSVQTPFGEPSGEVTIADIGGQSVAFLARHGENHRLLPSEIPSKANIWALKSLGVQAIVGVSAVGSLQEEMAPCDFVLPHQIIDRTKCREQTFMGEGLVGHMSFADPICSNLRECVIAGITSGSNAEDLGLKVHPRGTYLCMEGPVFSTRAESHMYRSWGCDVIGMTAIPEAKLAMEAEIAYCLIGMVTDYDCWRERQEAVSVSGLLENMHQNTSRMKTLIPHIAKAIPENFESPIHSAAKFGLFTPPALVPPAVKERLGLFYGKYWQS